MTEILRSLFSESDRGWWHTVSLLSVSYALLTLLALIIYFIYARRDLKFRSAFLLLSLSLFGMSVLYVMKACNLGAGNVRPEMITAFCVSGLTLLSVFFLDRLVRHGLNLPNPSKTKALIENLQAQIQEYQNKEDALRQAQTDLEKTIQNRTRELIKANQVLEKQYEERKQIEQTLRESEEYFRALIENALDITAIIDKEGKIKYQSPSIERILGYQKSELIGKSVFDYIHHEDVFRIKRVFVKGLERPNGARFFEFRFKHCDGSWRVLESVGKNLLTEPTIQGMIVNARDITERKRAENEIRFLPAMMQAISGAEDFHSALETTLRQVCEMTGWPYAEAWIPRSDKKILDSCSVWYGAESFRAFHQASVELKFLPKMGLPGRVWQTKQPEWFSDLIKQPKGFTRTDIAKEAGIKAGFGMPIMAGEEVLAVLFFFLREDKEENKRHVPLLASVATQLGAVLQRKKAQEDLRKAHEELEKRVQERTGELAASNQSLQRQITERQTIEAALQESKQKFQSLVNSVDGILWEYDLKSEKFLFVSPQAEHMLGYPVQIWFSDPTFWEDHVHGEDREAILEFRRRLAKERKDAHCEYRMVTADGRTVWFRDMVSVVLENGQAIKLRGTMVDITTRRLTETALQEERNFVTAVLDTAGALMMITDDEGRIIRMNRACEKASGFREGELKGAKPFWDVFLIPEEVKTVKSIFARLLAGQFPATYEASWLAKDGSRTVIAWSNTVLINREKGERNIVATGIDITKRKEAEQKLKEVVKDLALSNEGLDKYSEDLKQANERLKKLDELKSNFISAASHELKTPLTSLKGYVEMVLEGEAGPINEEQKEYLNYVKESTDRLHRLLKELLDISKIESGQARMNLENTDLQVLIREEAGFFNPQAVEKHISLTVDIEPSLKPIFCDANMIRQVLDNLLSNAIKYTLLNGKVTIFGRNHDYGVQISVQDTGVGIKPEDQMRIFEPFQHIEKNAMLDKVESTGLGLALVKRIVEAHGGRISVKSIENEGAVFTVLLPLETQPKKINELVGQIYE